MTSGIVPHTVVLVDDTPEIRALVRTALERRGGFRVVGEAGDGAEGLEVVRATRPDVVLLDIAMPVMDGLEALPLILRASPGTRVVMLSGFGADRMARRAMEAGAVGYLQKGMPVRKLIAQLRSLVSSGEQLGDHPAERVAADPATRSAPRTPGSIAIPPLRACLLRLRGLAAAALGPRPAWSAR